jgi:hypothetical protein
MSPISELLLNRNGMLYIITHLCFYLFEKKIEMLLCSISVVDSTVSDSKAFQKLSKNVFLH